MQIANPAPNVQQVVEVSRSAKAELCIHHHKKQPALLQRSVTHPLPVHVVGACCLAPDQVIRVVRNPHLVGFGVSNPHLVDGHS